MGVPFSQMPDDLINDPDMTLSALRAWHVIYVETLGRPGWDMSYGQIAERIGTKRRATAVDAIDLLLRKGWLIRMRQKSQHGDDAPNLFSVCREPHVPWNERQTVQGGTPDRTRGGTPDRTHRENHLPVEQPLGDAEGQTATFSLQHQPAVKEKKGKALVDEQFAEWWEVVPKKVAKGQARDSFTAAVKKAGLGTLIAATKKGTGWNPERERKYQPNPSTWLRGERWNDDESTPEPTSGRYSPDLDGYFN